MAKTPPTVAIRTLNLELKKIQEEPVEGFIVSTNDDNLFHWKVAIFGPPDTLYQGGYFKAEMKFPYDYPYAPPSFRFLTKMWHPNIYDSGDVCISILHPPVDDPRSGELASERWNPTQSVSQLCRQQCSRNCVCQWQCPEPVPTHSWRPKLAAM
ncbi:Ubiquitin-conjugating enzyme E2 R2 [Holothuria leucospilota]|uniref:Ubiquitin-conjugating enzyme E2 R2 n=1 Tax=Holothuria leucospilota TaxID=206669 RepID=A0A9Q1BM95_HOLLE|nr:Ubiquitin-conjugating enzyme E2 R2 [Holothuria leucospilota]